jgi:hypothetical protein
MVTVSRPNSAETLSASYGFQGLKMGADDSWMQTYHSHAPCQQRGRPVRIQPKLYQPAMGFKDKM